MAQTLDERTLKWLPWLVAVTFFMQMLDGTIMNTALPSIAKSFNENPLRMQAVLIAYMLTVAVILPASGWLADRVGAKKLMTLSIGLFTFGSLLCALSPNLMSLIGARVVQAVGGALMVPVGRLVIVKAYPKAQLIQVLSFITMPGLAGSLAGPALGGFLVEFASWNWIFLINLPIGAVGIAATYRFMPHLKAEKRYPFDFWGFAVFAASLVAMTLALEGVSDLGLKGRAVGVLVTLAVAGQLLYWGWLARRPFPIFPSRLFSNLAFSVGLTGNLLTRLGTGATPFLIPLFLQVVVGYSPLEAGLMMMPLALASLISKMAAKPLTVRFGYRTVLIVNTFLQGFFIFGLSRLTINPGVLVFCVHMSLLGAVNALQFSVLNTYTLMSVSDEDAGGGNALLSVAIQIAQSLAVGVAAAVLFHFTGSATIVTVDRLSILKAFQGTFMVIGVVSSVSAFLFFLAPREHKRKTYRSPGGVNAEADEKKSEEPEKTEKDETVEESRKPEEAEEETMENGELKMENDK